jgi:hypothetical protein
MLPMFVIVLAVVVILVMLKMRMTENFFIATVNQVATADPLKLNITQPIVDPTGWRWDSDHTITTVIKIKAITGQLNFRDIMAIPSLGYHSNSGLEYSSWNKVQGTNGWSYLNEARHGHGWFWWQPTVRWQNLTDLQKSKELEIKLIVNNSDKIPEFPVSFGLKIQDFNYGHVLRVWLTFTHDPMVGMVGNQKAVATHTIAPPLILKNTNLHIAPKLWRIHKNIATVVVPLSVQQGGIDWTNIQGTNKGAPTRWFSWDINHNTHAHGPTSIILQCKINNHYKAPLQFPVLYKIKIKDKHMERYIIVQLKLLGNPFTYEYVKPKNHRASTTKLSKHTNLSDWYRTCD